MMVENGRSQVDPTHRINANLISSFDNHSVPRNPKKKKKYKEELEMIAVALINDREGQVQSMKSPRRIFSWKKSGLFCLGCFGSSRTGCSIEAIDAARW